jgi:hypothetical protein
LSVLWPASDLLTTRQLCLTPNVDERLLVPSTCLYFINCLQYVGLDSACCIICGCCDFPNGRRTRVCQGMTVVLPCQSRSAASSSGVILLVAEGPALGEDAECWACFLLTWSKAQLRRSILPTQSDVLCMNLSLPYLRPFWMHPLPKPSTPTCLSCCCALFGHHSIQWSHPAASAACSHVALSTVLSPR